MREKQKHGHSQQGYLRMLDLWADTERRIWMYCGRLFLLLAIVALILRPFTSDGGSSGLWTAFLSDDPVLLALNLGLPLVLLGLGVYILWRPARYNVRRQYVERLAIMNPAIFLGVGALQIIIGIWIMVGALSRTGMNLPNIILVTAFVGLGLLQVWRATQIRAAQRVAA